MPTSHTNLAFALFKSGQLSQAEHHLRLSIDITETIREQLGNEDGYKISIFDRQIEPYQVLQYVLVEQHKISQALEISERSRARALVDLFSRDATLAEAKLSLSRFPSIAEVQAIARNSQSTLVEYSLLNTRGLDPNKLLIWVIRPSGEVDLREIHIEPRSNPSALSDLLQSVLSALVHDAQQDFGTHIERRDLSESQRLKLRTDDSSPLKTLYQYLIAPIQELLPSDQTQNVILVPHGDLFLLPFAALQEPETGQFLIERHTLQTVPSIQVLQAIDQRQCIDHAQGTQPALVVGNPKVLSPNVEENSCLQRVDALPAAEVEATAIATLLQTHPLIGANATKSVVLEHLPHAKYVHLGTHGIIDDIDQLGIPGAIALSANSREIEFLSASEIFNHHGIHQKNPLKAKLVVLSACSSGLGKVTGDGVVGLSRSLLAAGVPRLVVSLWAVNDLSTAFLMTRFYRNLLRMNQVAESLREAQCWLRHATKEILIQAIQNLPLNTEQKRTFKMRFLRLLKSGKIPFHSPYYWAAFHLIGDNSPCELSLQQSMFSKDHNG